MAGGAGDDHRAVSADIDEASDFCHRDIPQHDLAIAAAIMSVYPHV
jgi:hypothetical protein